MMDISQVKPQYNDLVKKKDALIAQLERDGHSHTVATEITAAAWQNVMNDLSRQIRLNAIHDSLFDRNPKGGRSR